MNLESKLSRISNSSNLEFRIDKKVKFITESNTQTCFTDNDRQTTNGSRQKQKTDFDRTTQSRKSKYLGVRCEFIKQFNINNVNIQKQKERQFNHKQVTNPENNFRLKCIYGKSKKDNKQQNHQVLATHRQKNKIMNKIKINEQSNQGGDLLHDDFYKIAQQLIDEDNDKNEEESEQTEQELQEQIEQLNKLDKGYKRGQRVHFITQNDQIQEYSQKTNNIHDFVKGYQNQYSTKTYKHMTEQSQDEYSNENKQKQMTTNNKSENIQSIRELKPDLMNPSHFEQKFLEFKNMNHNRKGYQIKRAKTKMFEQKVYRQQSQSAGLKIKNLKQKHNYGHLDMSDKQLLFHQRRIQYNQLNLDKKYEFYQYQTDKGYNNAINQLVNDIQNYKQWNNNEISQNQSAIKINNELYSYMKQNMMISEMDNIQDLLVKDMYEMGQNKKKGNGEKKKNIIDYEVPKQRTVNNVLKMIEDIKL